MIDVRSLVSTEGKTMHEDPLNKPRVFGLSLLGKSGELRMEDVVKDVPLWQQMVEEQAGHMQPLLAKERRKPMYGDYQHPDFEYSFGRSGSGAFTAARTQWLNDVDAHIKKLKKAAKKAKKPT